MTVSGSEIRESSQRKSSSIRNLVKRSERKFNAKKELPADALRVFTHLKELHGEEYALTFVFIMRTVRCHQHYCVFILLFFIRLLTFLISIFSNF